MTIRRRSAKRSGFSLVEAVLSISLFAMVVGTVGVVAVSGSGAYQASSVRNALVQGGKRTMAEVTDVLMQSTDASLTAYAASPLWHEDVVVDVLDDVAGDGTVTWTSTRIRFVREEGEVDDGIDNNGNGLVDEGVLELVTDFGGDTEQTRILTRWVAETYLGEDEDGEDENDNGLADERGFCLERDGSRWVVRLTLQRFDPNGSLITETFESSLEPRN